MKKKRVTQRKSNVVQIRMSDPLYNKLLVRAIKENRTLSGYIRKILIEAVSLDRKELHE